MAGRTRTDLPHHLYPANPWALVETAYTPQYLHLTETIFALSNGYLGVRATLDEGTPAHQHGSFVNGFHETWPLIHPEEAFGFAKTGQTIVNAPDTSVIAINVDGERLVAASAGSFCRTLDFRTGVLERSSTWVTGDGVRLDATWRRLVSLTRREVAAYQLGIEVDRPITLLLSSLMVNRQDESRVLPDTVSEDPRLGKRFGRRVLLPAATEILDLRVTQGWVTERSRMGLVVAMDHQLDAEDAAVVPEGSPDFRRVVFTVHVTPERPVRLTKVAAYRAAPTADLDAAWATVTDALDTAIHDGFERLREEQERHLVSFWDRADVEVEADPEIQQAVRWNLFQVHQASAQLDGNGIPAKGLTGQAYDGHYFWDTEIHVVPFLAYTNPTAAADLIRFRHGMLDAARRRALELSQEGALFPWRTITGEEASAFFEASTAQYHINADVAQALRTYHTATGDDEILWSGGAEVLAETARLWQDLGFTRSGRFHINGVTGPDEYTALVDDNAYTNMMARMNLRFAAAVMGRMRLEQPDRYAALAERIGLDEGEPLSWATAADAMYVPYEPTLGITPQDDDFLEKETWDLAHTPPERYPLLLHYHPLVLYRFQVLKQADVVLAMFLLGDEFPPELKKANFDYYDPITTGDSSLSAFVQSIMAAEVGYVNTAMEYFLRALYTDLADLHANTTDGVHMASAGGVWMALVHGFGGMRHHDGRLAFDPRLPAQWQRMRFRVRVLDRDLVVDLDHRRLHVESKRGAPLVLWVRGEPGTVAPGHPLDVSLAADGS